MAHDDVVKAKVLAALLAGGGVNEVARQFDVDKSQVSRWWAKAKKTRPEIADIEIVRAETKVRNFENMIGDFLEENLTTLSAQARHFRDPGWMNRQNAHDMAILNGTIADRTIRILQAAQAARQAGSGEQPHG